MIISATFSKPVKNIEDFFDHPYKRIKIKAVNTAGKTSFFAEFFTEKQAFHKQFSEKELNEFIEKNAGYTFKNCVVKTQTEEITYLANKKGKISKLVKNFKETQKNSLIPKKTAFNKKNYILQEGTPIPFLILLGIMTPEGKIINSKNDKFRQINRFLEFIDDILPEILQNKIEENSAIKIVDFGCGKSYLTFAAHYFFTQIKHTETEIIGLDLKEDVIEYCNEIAKKLGCKGLLFKKGDIAEYNKSAPDIVITLHACNTATDYALNYAVKHNCKAILSVPCCQHEINEQISVNLKEKKLGEESAFFPLLKYGLIKEKFSSLVTDALRAQYLETCGYSVQILEFIDAEHTPKNLLIRAVKKSDKTEKNIHEQNFKLEDELQITPTLKKLLEI